jgi:DNA-binding beta-propeller fold protein YncE
MKKVFFVVFLAVALMAFGLNTADAEPQINGIAYIQGHGGHVAVLNLTTGEVGRITHGKPSDALTVSKDEKTLYVFSLDGHSKEINLETGEQTEWQRHGKKHCGSNYAPDGTIWVSDMADGHVYVYDPKSHKLVDKFPVSKSICGINFSKDGKVAYISDMPGAFISIVDVKTKKVIGKIAGVGNFLHRAEVNPAGTELWQSDGSELRKGKAIGVGYADAGATPGAVSIIDLKTGNVKDRIIIGGNPHDIDFTPDGRYALVSVRQIPEREDSAIVVINTATKRVEKIYSTCKKCHGTIGIEVPDDVDGGRPFLCAVDVAWGQRKFPAAVEPLASFTER